jgi:hypothetical protein
MGAIQLNKVFAGTTPLVTLSGDISKVVPLQIVMDNGLIIAFG